MLRIEVACADGDQLGEGPLWDVDEQRLYWIGSYGPAIHRMEPNGSKKTWKLPEPIGSLVLRRSAARSWRSAADSLRLILVPARPSASVKASQANCGPVSTTARPIGRVGSSPGQWISKNVRRSANCSGSIPTFRFIHWMGKSSAPTGRAGARTDAPSTSPTRVAARSTLTTTIR
jgi:hypothetical protein